MTRLESRPRSRRHRQPANRNPHPRSAHRSRPRGGNDGADQTMVERPDRRSEHQTDIGQAADFMAGPISTYCGSVSSGQHDCGRLQHQNCVRANIQPRLTLTRNDTDDSSQMGHPAAAADHRVGRSLGNGANDTNDVYATVAARHPDESVVAPLRSTAVESATAETNSTQRAGHPGNIAKHGRIGWQKASGYNKRSRVETTRWSVQAGHRQWVAAADRCQAGNRDRRVRLRPQPYAESWTPDFRPHHVNVNTKGGLRDFTTLRVSMHQRGRKVT
jgi:hypothetical protein